MIKDNLKEIQERIDAAAGRAGRRAQDTRLMVVSKTQPIEKIQEVYDLGVRLFGENRIHEAAEKFEGRFEEAELHLIGHIQRNKARKAVEISSCIQSLAALRTFEALEKQSEALDRQLSVLLEFNTAGEESKQGLRSEDELFRLTDRLLESDRISPVGLMTMAPFTSKEAPIRHAFQRLYALREECRQRYGADRFPVLSMGMTNDYEIAVEEGSTLVRIGTAVFGARG